MKTIKRILISLGIVIILSNTYSCNDEDFLTEKPKTFFTLENVVTSANQIDQILVTAYNQLRYLWGNDNRIFKMQGTDLWDVHNNRTGSSYNLHNPALFNAGNSSIEDIYNQLYKIISTANLALQQTEREDISFKTGEKEYLQAQGRFFRAFAYRYLGQVFGGVPIVTEPTETPRYDYVRETRLNIYQFVIDEFEAILPDLPVRSEELGRLVKGAPQHFLSEMYLAKGILEQAEGVNDGKASYQKSIDYANQLIDGGTYHLMTQRFGNRVGMNLVSLDVMTQGPNGWETIDTLAFIPNVYWDLFQQNNINYEEGNLESIWAFRCVKDFVYGIGANKDDYTLWYPNMNTPLIRDGCPDHIISGGGPTYQYVGGFPNSGSTQTYYARDEVWADKWGEGDIRNSDICNRRRWKANNPASPYFPLRYEKGKAPIVPFNELYVRHIPSGDVVIEKLGENEYGFNPLTDVVDELGSSDNFFRVFPLTCKATSYFFKEEVPPNDIEYRYFTRDDYYCRLAETYLIRAEAKQRNGDKTGTADDINVVRQRSGCKYLVSAGDVDDNFSLILDERVRELNFEECRWCTLLRMGGTIAVDRIKKYAMRPEEYTNSLPVFNLWPIPQRIIDMNLGAPMEQNPGWSK
jgi:hypothetical protein